MNRFSSILLAFLFASNLLFGQIKFNEILPSNTKINTDPEFGKTADWIELYNNGASSVNIGGYYLTDDASEPRKWVVPSGTTIASKGFLIIWLDGKNTGLHAGFKISADGENMRLYSNSMLLVDTVKYENIDPDVAYGRLTDGVGVWKKLAIPTPGKTNNPKLVVGIAPKPNFSVSGGFYNSNQTIALSSSIAGATIRYTTDGSEPTASSPVYSSPISASTISRTTLKYGYDRKNNTGIQKYSYPSSLMYPTNRYNGLRDCGFVLKAKVFHPDYLPSYTSANTYFIGFRKPTLPVVSIITDKNNFFNADSGIYIQGTNGISNGYITANWNQDWERQGYIEYFDASGKRQFGINMGISTMGAVSRGFDLKSLSLAIESKFDQGKIKYPLFGSSGLTEYSSFVLRNSGNDWESGCFARDAIIQSVLRGQVDLETQSYQPVVMYLNGEYWGLINMREKQDGSYYAGYHDYADKSEIDNLKFENESNVFYALDGDVNRFNEMMKYLRANSVSDSATFEYVKKHYLDIDNLINNYIAQLYCQNTDWPGNNFRLWRPRTENGKFRFPLYDTDFGYGLWGGEAYTNPFSNFDSNKDKVTVELFTLLLKNENFKNEFIQRFAYMLNTTYLSDRLKTIANPIESAIATERDTYTNAEWTRTSSSGQSVASMITWGGSRISYMKGFLNSRYGSKDWGKLTVNYSSTQGTVAICGLPVASGYSGDQYKNTPIRLTAIPADGYQFVRWETGTGTELSKNMEYYLTIADDYTIKAVFEVRSIITTIKINEVMASNNTTIKNELDKYEDWIELYNSGATPVDVAGLYVSQSTKNITKFKIPYGYSSQTTIPAGGFLLFWADGKPEEGVLHLPFKLSKDADTVIFTQKLSNGTLSNIDNLTFGQQNIDISYGRYLDGSSNKIIFTVPTPNASNTIQGVSLIDGLKINEFMAKNSSTIKEETGTYADYIEIYNSNSTSVDIGGLFVTNDLNVPNKCMIPKGNPNLTTIPAKGFYIIWCDKQSAINPNHVDFKLDASKGDIEIVQLRGASNYIIDKVSYTNQGEDISYGVLPEGSTTWKYMVKPTPGSINKNDTTINTISGLTINECLASNTKTKTDENGEYDDYIEFYNGTSNDIDLGGLFVTDSAAQSLKFRISRSNSSATTVKANQWITFWADGNPEQGSLHLDFDLSSQGEKVSLAQVTQNGIVVIDTMTFGKQTADVSYGRFPEKSDNKELMSPTFNARNTSANDIALLKSISSNVGSLAGTLQNNVFTYKILLPEGVTTIPTISVVPVNVKATYTIVQAKSLSDAVTITVISPSGIYTNVYTVTFGTQMSTDATLKSLSVANSTLNPTFTPTTYYYTANTTSALVPLISAVPNNSNAVVKITYATSMSKNTVITVTAESGDIKEYVISHLITPTVLNQWTDDCNDNLNTNIFTSLASGGSYTLTEANQEFKVHFVRNTGAVNDDYFSYKIPESFYLSANPNLYISFDAVCTENKTEPTNKNIALRVEVVDADGKASNISYITETVSETKTTFNLDFTGVLEGSDGNVDKTKIREVRFYFEKGKNDKDRDKTAVFDNFVFGPLVPTSLSPNANLATLTSSAGTLSPVFVAATTDYTLTLPAGTTTIPTISATAAQTNASIQISQASKIDGIATVRVLAQDKSTNKIYTVKFVVTPTIVEGYTENIVKPDIKGWSVGNSTYSLAYNAGTVDVNYNRSATSGNDAISFNLSTEAFKILNLTNYPYFAIKLKTTKPINLRVDYFDVNGNITNSSPVIVPITSTIDSLYVFSFNGKFSQTNPAATVDISKIYGVKLYFDAGSTTASTAQVSIDKLLFGSDVTFALNYPPVISTIPSQSVMQGQTFTNILLNSYVVDDHTSAQNLVWTYSTPTNLNVSINNNVLSVTPKSETWIGSEAITFTCTDEEGVSSTKAISFNVTELKVPVSSVSFIQSSVNMAKSATLNLRNYLSINPSTATIQSVLWASDNANLTIDANGVATNNLAFGTETVYVTATVSDKSGNNYVATITVVITGCPTPISQIDLNYSNTSLINGQTLQLNATITPSNACVKSVSIASSEPSIAAVTAAGFVTAKSVGSAVISFTYNDGFSVKVISCTINVLPIPVTSITLNPSSNTSLMVGDKLVVTTVVLPEDAPNKNLTWTSSDTNFVKVSSMGELTAIKVGSAVITATSIQNPTVKTTLNVTVNPVPVSSIVFMPEPKLSMAVGEEQTIIAVLDPTNATEKGIVWSSSNQTLAKVVGGVVTALNAGTVVITATSVQNSSINQSVKIEISNVLPNQVSINPSSDLTIYVGASLNLTAKILPDDAENKNVKWTSSESFVKVDANGKITGIAPGVAKIIATSEEVASVSDTINITVLPIDVEQIVFNPQPTKSMIIGELQAINYEIVPSNATYKNVTWSSSDINTATVSSTGVVTAKAKGTVTITATSDQYSSIKQSVTITINEILPDSIDLSPSTAQILNVGFNLIVTAKIFPVDAANQNITWSSSDEKIATVDATGKIYGVSAGTVQITATSQAQNTVYANISIKVENVLISKLNVLPESLNLILGQESQLSVTITPSNATLKTYKWSTSDNSIAEVDANGYVISKSVGNVKIYAIADDFGKAKDSCLVSVSPVMPVSIIASDISLLNTDINGKQILYSFTPDTTTDKTVLYSSLDNTIASVDANGLVKPVGLGSTVITLKSKADPNISKNINVTVDETIFDIISLSVDPSNLILNTNKSQALTATITPQNASITSIEWKSENDKIATVNANGIVNAISAGTTNIILTVITPGASKTVEIPVKVENIQIEKIELNKTQLSMDINGNPEQLIPVITPLNATFQSLQWQVVDENVVTVTQNGMVTPVNIGSTIVRCTAKDGSGKFAECNVTVSTVNPESVKIDSTALSININDVVTLHAKVFPDNAPQEINWSIQESEIASINENGTVTGLKEGNTFVIATSKKDANVYQSIPLKVSKVLVSAMMLDKTMLNLNLASQPTAIKATIYPANATDKSISWSVSPENIIDVKGGVVSVLALGTATVACSANDGSGTKITCNVTVSNVEPTDIVLDSSIVRIKVNDIVVLKSSILPELAPQNVNWMVYDNSIATIDENGKLTAKTAGNTNIGVTSAIKASVYKIIPLIVTEVPVTDINLNISELTVNLPSNNVTLIATVQPSEATSKNIEWISSNSSIATVDGNGIVKFISDGDVQIIAKTNNGLSDTCSIKVNPIQPTSITFDKYNIQMYIGDKSIIQAAVLPDNAKNKTITWSSSKTGIASISNLGEILAVSAGTTIVKAETANGISSSCIVTVDSVFAKSVIINKNNDTLFVNDIDYLSAIVLPDNTTDKNIVWRSSDNNVVTVSNGKITAVSSGFATISATSSNNVANTCKVVVKDIEPTDISVKVSNTTMNIKTSQSITVEFVPSYATLKDVEFSSNAPIIASVDEYGNIIANDAGDAIITVKTANGITKYINIKVNPIAVTSISLNINEVKLLAQENQQLIATIYPSNASNKTIEWTSSNELIASVDKYGKITAKSKGNAIIRATASSGVYAECSVEVLLKTILVEKVIASIDTITLNVGQYQTIQSTVLPDDATNKSLVWTISPLNIASVDQTGIVTAKAIGRSVVTLSSSNGIFDSVIVNVVPVIAQKVEINLDFLGLGVGENQTIQAQVFPANATNKAIVWSSANSNIATISSSGKVYGNAVGTTYVYAKIDKLIDSCKVEISQIVIPAESVVTDRSLVEISVDSIVKVTATVNPYNTSNKSLIWNVEDGSIASVDLLGNITALSVGETKIIVSTLNKKTAEIIVKVLPKLASSIELNFYNKAMEIDENVILLANVLPINTTNKTIVWSSSDTTVATVSSNGKVKAIKAGNAIITAKALYGKASSQCKITVNPKLASFIALSFDNKVVEVNETFKLIAYVSPTNVTDTTIIWASSDTNVATVDKNGLITAIGYGIATITAATNNNLQATCEVQVEIDNVAPQIAAIPEQKTSKGKPFAILDLSKYVTDDNTPINRIIWSATVSNHINVEIDSKGQAKFNVTDYKWYGSEIITVFAMDEQGLITQSDIKLTVSDGVSIDEIVNSDELKVYPNPNDGKFNLMLNLPKTSKPLQLSIFDVLGEVVYKDNIGTNFKQERHLNIRNLIPGVYYIQINDGDKIFRTSFIIE